MRGNNIIIMNITYNIKLEGKKLGSVTSRNQILLLPCQLEMGQKIFQVILKVFGKMYTFSPLF